MPTDSDARAQAEASRWGVGEKGVALQTVDKGRLHDGMPVRWVIAGQYAQPHDQIPEGENILPCVLRRVRSLGEITTLECRLPEPVDAVVHLGMTTRRVRDLSLVEGSPLFLQLDPQGARIMSVRGTGAQVTR